MRNELRVLFLIAMNLLSSCNNGDDIIDVVEASNDNSDIINIGDEYQGGIVYYILKEEDKNFVAGETHGLIASFEEIKASENEYFWWYCLEDVTIPSSPYPYQDFELIGAVADGIGYGRENTLKIINYCTPIDGVQTIAHICDNYMIDYDGVIYDDWFLPSRDEVIKMINQHNPPPLGETLVSENPNVLSLSHRDGYPTSTERSDGSAYYFQQMWVDACDMSYPDACIHARSYEESKTLWVKKIRPIRYF